MTQRLTYEELLKELRENRDKKENIREECFDLFVFAGLGEAIYAGHFDIRWKGEEYSSGDMPDDIAKEIEDELFAPTVYQKNEELFREKAQDIIMEAKSEFYNTYNMRYAPHFNK